MEPADVISHAGNVQSFGMELTRAAGRGESVDLGVETYGLIGQVFSLPVRVHIAAIASSINELANALPDVADALRDSADATRQTDEDHAKLFNKYKGS
ncbi:Excreted virulence factor EspC, type VII ESX diderm [Lentzea waywayandensis]|uniref:Excreted virulence factor EspC, type VII ESX diderm n=1 Tax=Lentzea waywayandensis TaxID=84724 RepID=A0A1I6FH75_9PSEU|nr:type VII secretion target [Lentzea waywayandensis]SFR29265.1 Excreted virulence factor EspC, type VII ESX diderm [Lentzea waywayandensis]